MTMMIEAIVAVDQLFLFVESLVQIVEDDAYLTRKGYASEQ